MVKFFWSSRISVFAGMMYIVWPGADPNMPNIGLGLMLFAIFLAIAGRP